MALPQLTEEQRAKAMEAARVSRERAKSIKADLASGVLTLDGLFALAGEDRVASRIKVRQALKSLPGIGETKAAHMMESVGIAAERRVGGLGAKQKQSLLDLL